jgi:hypothetical protein
MSSKVPTEENNKYISIWLCLGLASQRNLAEALVIFDKNRFQIFKFKLFKCTIQWVLVFSQGCATTTILIVECFHHSQKKPIISH